MNVTLLPPPRFGFVSRYRADGWRGNPWSLRKKRHLGDYLSMQVRGCGGDDGGINPALPDALRYLTGDLAAAGAGDSCGVTV